MSDMDDRNGPAGPARSQVPATTMDSIPGLAKVAATSLWRTGNWAMQTYVNAGRRVIGVALRPETAVDLAEDIRHVASEITRTLVGDDVEDRVRNAAAQNPVTQRMADAVPTVMSDPDRERGRDRERGADGASPNGRSSAARTENGHGPSLHRQGEDHLRRSRDVRYEEAAHPAYGRIMDELAPDEGRILRLLLTQGPQPSVDVRTGGPIGIFSSHLIAPGLNMIGARAGCRYVDRVPSYLNNLHRLGLVWFSRETLRDPMEYQVVEAQPDVLAAMHKVRAAKIVRRSIHLTPFGEDFCRDALSLDITGEFAAAPAHGKPDDAREPGEPPNVGPPS
jgi:hypothetical protein